MKERFIILAAAAVALVLFASMFLRMEGGFTGERTVPRPTTAEGGSNGYRAVREWLNASNIATRSLRARLDLTGSSDLAPGEDLPADALLPRHPTNGGFAGRSPREEAMRGKLAPTGNVLIVTLPGSVGFQSPELHWLDLWVRHGNTLFVLAALVDQPDWAHPFSDQAARELNQLTGLRLHGRKAKSHPGGVAFIEPQRLLLEPNRSHAYFSGVRAVVALSDFPRRTWMVSLPDDGFVLSLAHDRDSGEGVVWTRSVGSGRVLVSLCGSLFTHRALGRADNARLLANIVATDVAPGGAVLFDDFRQGLRAEYDPEKFYKDRRLYLTVAILTVLWLSWVLGSTSLVMPQVPRSLPAAEQLVRATGGFLARVLGPRTGARRMLELFEYRLSRRARAAPGGFDPWSFLAQQPRLAAADLRQLHEWRSAVDANRRVPLRRLHNLLLRIEAQLAWAKRPAAGGRPPADGSSSCHGRMS